MKTVEIPVRPHIKQWILQEYGELPYAKVGNFLGGIIRNAYHGAFFQAREIKSPGHTALIIKVSGPVAPYSWDENVRREVGYLLEEQFGLVVVSFMQGCINCGSSMAASVAAFYTHFGISEEDYDPDTLRGIYRTHETRKATRPALSPHVSLTLGLTTMAMATA